MKLIKHSIPIFVALFLTMLAPVCPAVAQSKISPALMGPWANLDVDSALHRLVIRRGELILLQGKTTIHGRLIPEKGDRFRYVINFIDGKPEGKIETVRLKVEGIKLAFTRGKSSPEKFTRLEQFKSKTVAHRKGFSYTAPQGWVSNVELYSRQTGKDPEQFDTDQLVHFYEIGMNNPSEDITIRLVDKPFEKMAASMDAKSAQPGLRSRRARLTVGERKGYVFDNSAPSGKQLISAKVYILPWNEKQSLVLAIPTLLRSFPFDLDRTCRAILASAK